MHDEAYVARQQVNNGRNSYYPGQFSFTSNRSIVAARSFREHMAFACSGVAGREIATMITSEGLKLSLTRLHRPRKLDERGKV